MSYLLRIEGVNLDRFVFDTRDLSTVRGASLLLLKAVERAQLELKAKGYSPIPLSVGASAGLFQIATDDPTGAAKSVREALRKGRLQHATFVVDVVADSGAFRTDNEALLTVNRWRQMQASTLAVPATPSPAEAVTPPACDRDGLRPALKTNPGPNRDDGSRTYLAAATKARRDAGRGAKQDFYAELTKLPDLPEFAQDFAAIANNTEIHTEILGGKLAVFYADGNAFGKLQQRLCRTPPTQALWDHYIRKLRREFLTVFLDIELMGKAQWKNADGVARFETLLWGGDELMFVMPASLGWRFASIFFEHLGVKRVSDARFPTKAEEPDHPFADDFTTFAAPDVLTHTAALVFCQDHAPIDRIKRLAKDGMAEFAKGKSRDRDQLACVVLESFDHLGTSYERAMARRYGGVVALKKMVLGGDQAMPLHQHLDQIANKVKALKTDAKSEFSRSQLRALVNAMIATRDAGEAAVLADLDKACLRWFRKATDTDKSTLRELVPLFGGDPVVLWLQLEELWDYALL